MHITDFDINPYTYLLFVKWLTFNKRWTWHLSDIERIAHPVGVQDDSASSTLLQLANVAISNLNLVTVSNVLSSEHLIYVSVLELLETL